MVPAINPKPKEPIKAPVRSVYDAMFKVAKGIFTAGSFTITDE